MPETIAPLDEFVCAVIEFAAADSTRGWLAAAHGAAAYDVPAYRGASIAIGHRGTAKFTDGRLTGRWESVVGSEQADWLLLTAGEQRVLVARAHVGVDPVVDPGGLAGAAVGDVAASDAAVECVLTGPRTGAAAAGAAAAVVGSAHGVWRTHVDRVRARLAIAPSGDEGFDPVQVARAASDIDAATLQITAAALEPATAPYVQAVARARGAADRLLASSRHALDASDPVARRWREVHAGCRLAARLLD